MIKIFDALEICLEELENGENMETVLARFPELAGELHPILRTSLAAKNMSAPEPSADTVHRGRARLMQRAAEMRESRAVPHKRIIPAFQRLALSFTFVALLLLSSTGLLHASASALPGEGLYPVKRTWEGLRLLLIFNEEARNLLEDQYEYERLHEVDELLVEGRHEAIQIAGVFIQVNGKNYVSGIQVILSSDFQLPANGTAVVLTGQTNAQGYVEIITLDLLPDGSVVPVGKPVEVELESGTESGIESGSGSNIQAPESDTKYYAMDGTLEAMSTTTLVVNGLTVYPENARVDGELCPGVHVDLRGYFVENGRFIVTEVEAKGSCSSGGGGDSHTNINDSSDTNDDKNSGYDNPGDDHEKDDDGNDNGKND
ncbi:MAG: DUF5667 domain-containing protein [Anaerolineales bacterium]